MRSYLFPALAVLDLVELSFFSAAFARNVDTPADWILTNG